MLVWTGLESNGINIRHKQGGTVAELGAVAEWVRGGGHGGRVGGRWPSGLEGVGTVAEWVRALAWAV